MSNRCCARGLEAVFAPTTVRVTTVFRPIGSRTPATPPLVTAKYSNNGGSVTTKTLGVGSELVLDAVGKVHIDVPCDANGKWVCDITGTTSSVVVTSHNEWTVGRGL